MLDIREILQDHKIYSSSLKLRIKNKQLDNNNNKSSFYIGRVTTKNNLRAESDWVIVMEPKKWLQSKGYFIFLEAKKLISYKKTHTASWYQRWLASM